MDVKTETTMDLSDTKFCDTTDKDSLLTESPLASPESASIASTDAGFVSDSTVSTPNLEDERKLAEDIDSENHDTERQENSCNGQKNDASQPSSLKLKADLVVGNDEREEKQINGVEPSEHETKQDSQTSEIETDSSKHDLEKSSDTEEQVESGDVNNTSEQKSLNTSADEDASSKSQETATEPEQEIQKHAEFTEKNGTENQLSNMEEPESKTEEEEYLDILGNGLLKKKILKPGNGVNTRPSNGNTVKLKFEGRLEDGTMVESGETTFILNDGDVIVAFDLCVALMEAGEKCELFASSRYAYGELGRDPDIPKDASIIYVLDLLEVQPPVDLATIGFEQRLLLGEQKRERGNYLFGRKDYSSAINSYTKAVKVLDDTDLNAGLDEQSRTLLSESYTKCYNNLAACQLKIDAFDAAIRSCEKVLGNQEHNVKALFRLGKAYGAKNEVDTAISFLKRAIKKDPESKMLHQEMFNLVQRKNKETETERELYKRMLGVKKDGAAPEDGKNSKSPNSMLKFTLIAGGIAAAMVSVGFAWYRTS